MTYSVQVYLNDERHEDCRKTVVSFSDVYIFCKRKKVLFCTMTISVNCVEHLRGNVCQSLRSSFDT